MSSIVLRLMLVGAALAASASGAQAEGWRFSAGADYTTGDYGGPLETNILIAPLSAAYGGDRWRASITVPYVRIEGAGTITPGAGAGGGGAASGGSSGSSAGGLGNLLGGVTGTVSGLLGVLPGVSPPPPPPPPPGSPPPPPTPVAVAIEEEGVGDVTLSLDLTPLEFENGRITLDTDVRLATGDEFLGAEETIASIALGYAHDIGTRAAIYGAVGYQVATESEIDATFVNAGIEGFVSDRILLGLGADWAEASVDGRENQAQANVYFSYTATDQIRLVAYVLGGLTESSPESGGGLRIVFRP